MDGAERFGPGRGPRRGQGVPAMHELGIVSGVLDTVRNTVRHERAARALRGALCASVTWPRW